jgi:hypothetical protein
MIIIYHLDELMQNFDIVVEVYDKMKEDQNQLVVNSSFDQSVRVRLNLLNSLLREAEIAVILAPIVRILAY